ncbi:MAG: hypothetical protein WB441_02860 [Nocardioidaceae bacterium]
MSLLRRNADLLLGIGLAVLMAIEVWVHEGADTARAVPAALLAGLALAMRRRLALASFLLAWAGLSGVLAFAAGAEEESLGFIVIFFIAYYSLGRWTAGREAWAGVVLVLASMVAFAIGDSVENDVSLSEVGLNGIAFTMGFVGGPGPPGWHGCAGSGRRCSTPRTYSCRATRRNGRVWRSPRSGPGSLASCTTWSPTPSPSLCFSPGALDGRSATTRARCAVPWTRSSRPTSQR